MGGSTEDNGNVGVGTTKPDKTLDVYGDLGLRAVRYKLKDSGKEEVGLIAEEVDELVEELVGYDEEGKPLMVKYEKLSVYLLEVVKQQRKELVAMKRQIEQLRSDRGQGE